MNTENLNCIKNVSSWDSGGGMELDLIELSDGRVLAVSEDVIVLYSDIEDLQAGDASKERPHITL